VKDPFGHQWMHQHEIENVSPAEMQKRRDAMGGECGGAEPPENERTDAVRKIKVSDC
jgi:hypothetical protein